MTAGDEQLSSHIVVRLSCRPSEIGHFLAFFASDESPFPAGIEFIADHGETIARR
jgi:hypothetical protein